MAHLSDEQLLALARKAGDSEFREHAKACSKCSPRLEMWTLAVERLPAIVNESVSDSEIHQIQTLFRHHRPEKKSVTRWVAALIRSSGNALDAAVRGSSNAEMFEYEAGPFTLMMENGPLQDGTYPLHGQVFHRNDGTMDGARVVISSEDGSAFVEAIDQFGEFHFEVPRAGKYHATVWTLDGFFSIADLQIGGSCLG